MSYRNIGIVTARKKGNGKDDLDLALTARFKPKPIIKLTNQSVR